MTISNPGFESDLNQGWDVLGDVSRIAAGSDFAGSSGSYYANLTSSGANKGDVELFLGLSSGSLDSKYTNGSALRQYVDVVAGQILSFDWKFFDNEGDSGHYDDAAFVIHESSSQILSSVSISGATQEGKYEYTFQSSGQSLIGVAVFNAQDQAVNAVLKVDDFSLDGTGASANEPPVLADAGSILTYMEGDGAKVIDSSLTLTDVDDANIKFAVISISSGFQSTEDLLSFTDANGISGSWDASTGVLTLSGSATKAYYEQALESITYTNTNTDNPNTSNRTISWLVNDGNSNSTAVTSTITVSRVNDAPVATSSSLTIDEDQSYSFAASDFGFSDVDYGDGLKSVLLTSNPTEGDFRFDGEIISIGNNGLSILAEDIGKLQFIPQPDENGQGYATFSFKVVDQSDAQSEPATITINVDPVNDAPKINPPSDPVQTSLGSSAYSGSAADSSPGNVYIQETPSGNIGTVTQWKFYKPHANDGLWVTPVIYEKTESNTFIVRGIGRSRSASGPAGVYTFDFDLVEGSAVFANGNYTYGHIDKNLSGSGNTDTSTTGSISWGDYSGTWGFINTQNPVTTIGGSQSLGYRMERHYASELILSSGGSRIVGSVVEAGQNDDNSTLAGTVSDSSTLTASDPDSSTLRWSITGSPSTSYGSITIDAETGVWTYTLDNEAIATQALAKGESVTETFTARVSDEDGAYDDQIISITIYGTNDKPLILTTPGSSALSDFSSTTAGWSHGSLVNSSAWGSFLGAFGSGQSTSKTFSESSSIKAISFDWLRLDSWDGEHFKIKANGVEIFSRSFSLSTNVTTTSSGAIAGYGWTLTPHEYGNYWGNTGWNDQRFTIQITPPEGIKELTLELSSTLDQGASDEAWGIDNVVVETQGSTTSGTVTEAGSADDGSTFEGTSSVSGTISASDPDSATLRWSITGSPSTHFGSITIDAETGVWTFTLDNDANETQALAEGESVTETFTAARVSDEEGAYDEHAISITIYGTNDKPFITSTETNHSGYLREAGHSVGGVVDSGTPMAFGELTAADVDANSEITWSVIGLVDETYGTFSIDAESGEWSYALDNSKTAVQALFAEDTRTLTYTARVTDQHGAYSEQSIEITINGADDIVRQYADHVIGVSSEGQAGGGDRWSAVQALGAPDTNSYADLDTAWSPRERNGSGGSQADEYLELGFRRPVRATGLVIHETFGNGFVRRVDAIDTNGNVHLLWDGEDSSTSEVSAFSISLDQPTDYLVHGLKIWVDIDHTPDWEQIDAVELIGWATKETYQPLAPTLDQVAGNDVVNAAEKAAGITLTGQAEANSTVEVSWGNFLDTASVSSDRSWSLSLGSDQIPGDSTASSISLVAIDSEGKRSSQYTRTVRISSSAPALPEIDPVAEDDQINTYEKSVGVTLQGRAIGSSQVEINWDGNSFGALVSTNGSWTILIGGPNGTGVIPNDSLSSILSVIGIDADGNRSDPSETQLVIDTSSPAPPSLANVTTDNIINAAEKSQGISLNGLAESGTSVRLQWGENTYDALANSDGHWTVSVPTSAVPSDNPRSAITMRAIDVAGNQSSITRSRVSIDTTAPDYPVIAPLSNDDILNSSETSQSIILRGTAERNSLVEVSWNGHTFSTTASNSSRWNLTVDPALLPANGSTTTITASAVDDAGNRSGTASRTVVIDTAAPNAPTLNPIGQGGAINAALKSSGFIINGQSEAGATLKLTWERLEKQVKVADNGEWSVSVSSGELPRDGSTSVVVRAMDQAGNESSAVSQTVIVDTKPPRAPKLAGKIAGDGVLTAAEREEGLLISGTSIDANTVDVTFAGKTKIASVTSGRWEVMFNVTEIPVEPGRKQVVAMIARDTAGNTSSQTTAELILKTAPPAAPKIAAVGLASRVNAQLKSEGVTVSGQADDDVDRIELTWGGKIHSVPVSRGRWTVKLGAPDVPSDGLTTLTAVAMANGVRSSSASQSIEVDTAAPNAPAINVFGQGGFVNAAMKTPGLSMSGQAEAGSTVSLEWGPVSRQITTDPNGVWSLYLPAPEIPKDGLSSLSLIAIDPHGNRSSATTQSILLDSLAPAVPLLDVIAGDDVISAIERASGIMLTGRSEAESAVSITLAGVTRSVMTPSNGLWSLQLSSNELPSSGLSTDVLVSAKDSAGNHSSVVSRQLRSAYSAASVPTIDDVTIDNMINAAEARFFIVQGSADTGSLINLAIGSTTLTTTADQNSRWTLSLRANQLPSSDGPHQLSATSINGSGLSSPAVSRSVLIDRLAPNFVSATIEGNLIFLDFSEVLSSSAINPRQFSVRAGRSSLPVQSVSLDTALPSRLILQLGTVAQGETRLSISYTPNDQNTKVADLVGNTLARLRNVKPTTFRSSSSVTSLATNYRILELTGSTSVHATGNNLDNIISGNSGDNEISGGIGADVLTGLGGRDRFLYSTLRDSLFGTDDQHRFDHITDFAIGTDIIDGPSAVARGQVLQLGSINTLNIASLTSLLSTSHFQAYGASIFSLAGTGIDRTFVALNDALPGFNASSDAIIEISGYTGRLEDLQII